MTQRIILGPQYFPDPGVGRPIANGNLYIGEVDTDPTIPANQIQVSAIQESGISVEIDQPISLSPGGVPLYEGSPVTLTVEEEAYALTVLDNLDQQIYYVPNSVDIIFPTTFSDDAFVIYDNNDNTKKIKFEAENIDNETTRTIFMPNRDVDLSNKTDTFFIRNDVDETKKLGFNLSEISAITTRYLKMIDEDVDLGNRTDTFRIKDNTDNKKRIAFNATAITTETTRTIIMPDADVDLGNPAGSLVGSGLMWFLNTPPLGFLECDGSEINRTTYSNLYTVIGDSYGDGDGSTTFNLPDFRGHFLRGWDHGAGIDPNAGSRTDRGDGTTGDNVGTKQPGEYEDHSHSVQVGTGTGPSNFIDRSSTYSGSVSSGTSSSGGDETRPINTNIMICIKT